MIRRIRFYTHWWLAPIVAAKDVRAGHRLLLRDGRTADVIFSRRTRWDVELHGRRSDGSNFHTLHRHDDLLRRGRPEPRTTVDDMLDRNWAVHMEAEIVEVERPFPEYLTNGRTLPDGRVLDVVPLTFGRARLLLSADGATVFVDDCWCYDSPLRAVIEQVGWDGDGEPTGWMRHPASGRRRPGGDPHQEYVRA